MLALGCSFAAAFLLLGATHVHGLLAWVAVAPLVIASPPGGGWRRALVVGGLFGCTVALGGDARWVALAGQQYFSLPPWGAALAAGGLAVVFGGSFGLLLGVLMQCTLALPRGWSIVAFAAAWVVCESLVLGVIPYYPWVSLAATQASTPLLLQVAGVAGQAGLSFAVAATGTALGLAVQSWGAGVRAGGYVAIGVAILAAVALYGWARLGMAPVRASHGCTVAAIDARVSASDDARDDVLQRYATLTRQAVQRGADVIVWPESALPGYLELDARLQRRLREVVGAGATLIAGGPRADWAGDWRARLFNSAYQIDAASPLRSYDKRRLVPFAEYWPRIPVARPGWLTTEEVTSGQQPGVFAAGRCHLGVLICFEVEEPTLVYEVVRAGANVLLVLSNDAQLPPAAVAKEIGQAQLRAVETGLPLVRAANYGVSAVIDRYGVIQHRQSGGALVATPMPGEAALAVRAARLFRMACWLVTGLALAARLRR